MAEEFSYSQAIRLFPDEDTKKAVTFVMKVDDGDYASLVLPVIDQAFQNISDKFICEYIDYCDANDLQANIEYVESQLEELKVEFTYWIRNKCKS